MMLQPNSPNSKIVLLKGIRNPYFLSIVEVIQGSVNIQQKNLKNADDKNSYVIWTKLIFIFLVLGFYRYMKWVNF